MLVSACYGFWYPFHDVLCLGDVFKFVHVSRYLWGGGNSEAPTRPKVQALVNTSSELKAMNIVLGAEEDKQDTQYRE